MVDEELRKRIIERAKCKLGAKVLSILEAVTLQEYIEELEAAQQSTQEEDCPCGGKHVPEPVCCKNCGLRYLPKC